MGRNLACGCDGSHKRIQQINGSFELTQHQVRTNVRGCGMAT
jgi:hypothetical protein